MTKPTPSAPQIWVILARAHRALCQIVERSILDTGLGLSDFMVLEALLHKGPLSITAIQQKVLLALGSMTAAVDRLESKGLLIRTTTTADRRAKVLQLTAEGRRVAAQAFKAHAADLDQATAILSDVEIKQMYAPLKKLGLSAAGILNPQRLELIKKERK